MDQQDINEPLLSVRETLEFAGSCVVPKVTEEVRLRKGRPFRSFVPTGSRLGIGVTRTHTNNNTQTRQTPYYEVWVRALDLPETIKRDMLHGKELSPIAVRPVA